jgi:hypothetical protein
MKIVSKTRNKPICPYCAQSVTFQKRIFDQSFIGPHGCVYALKAIPNLVRAAHINFPCRCIVGIKPRRAVWVKPLVRVKSR